MSNSSQICKTCSIEKSMEDFHFRRDNSTYRKMCKKCWSLNGKKYNSLNKDKVTAYQKKFALDNSEHLKQYRVAYYITNKDSLNEKNKLNYLANKEKYNAISSAYYEKNKTVAHPLTQEQLDFRKKLNITKKRLRQRVLNVLKIKNWEKSKSLYEYIGCSQEQLIQHLESQFEPGISWENRAEWHIDHTMPLSFANTVDELYTLCFYLNLKPMWSNHNLSKHAKITQEGIEVLDQIKEIRGIL